MTEKESYVHTWAREHKTTVKILKAYPADKADLKPAEKCRTAKELAWVFVQELATIMDGAIKGKLEFTGGPALPATFGEAIQRLEADYPGYAARVEAMTDADWNGEMDFMVGPGKFAKVRRADVLWMLLYDQIHHRGQFSIYLRMAGAKVPSIYGPSGDEPWM